jgi:acetoin utilization deacetylase AcuC-like enzyme
MSWNHFKFYYTDHVEVPLPPGHRFPMGKYRMLRQALLKEGVASPHQLFEAPLVSDEDLLRAHTQDYIWGLKYKTLGEKELRPIGLTWSEELLLRSYTSVGGFVAATESALLHGFSALLAGGTHHAHADRGEGYCVFNDFAVASLRLVERGFRILILDLDVHQGNGNSSILGHRDDVFILSLHGEKNYPFRKVPSHLDIALKKNTDDETYLRTLRSTLTQIENIPFDILFYQAGVDNLKEDTLGTLDLTLEGLMERDRLVFEFAQRKNRPIAMAIGGGYASPIELTVEAHVNTFKVARKFFSGN